MTTSNPSNKRKTQQTEADLQGVDRLFGRDLRSEGWFVDPVGLRTEKPETSGALQRDEQPLDPALIWAMRWRRR